ncbi:MAG: cobalamin biosynthesis protein CbiG, partial [Caulobacteraceae bacterium]|nr:cobalamin biosynthesis protein CbiG [Caulobacteraceae bacterium]
LQPKKLRAHGPGDIPEFRHAELAAPGAASVWKVYYNGSVGGQSILGIPAARRIKQARGDRLKVWPFETGWKALGEADLAGVEVVMAEVYPSLVKAAPAVGEVKDLAQVRALAEHYAKLDEAGKLGALFAPDKTTAPDVIVDAQHEEGWILSV